MTPWGKYWCLTTGQDPKGTPLLLGWPVNTGVLLVSRHAWALNLKVPKPEHDGQLMQAGVPQLRSWGRRFLEA